MTFGLHHLPNAICVVRIVLILPIVMLLLAGEYRLALGLVLVAGASDALDGWLAKTFGWQTRLGGLLDPAADKLLLVSLFLTLTWLGLTPVWLTAVVLGRDLVIVSGAVAFNFLIRKVQPEPSKVSKLNSFLQLLYGGSVLALQAFGWPPDIVPLLTGAAVLVTSVVSGLDYVLTWGHRARIA